MAAVLAALALLACAGTAWADDDDDDGDDRPAVSGTVATDVTADSARLTGFVNPNDRKTHYFFEYGTTGAYGTRTATVALGKSKSWKSVSASISGLAPDVVHHFRLVAVNDKGQTTRGPDRNFTTLPAPAGSDVPGPGLVTPPTDGEQDHSQPPAVPDIGKSVLVEPAQGEVLARRPGGSFRPLDFGSELPVGTEIDARRGALALTSALPSGETQTGRFGGGRFEIRQGRRGYIDLHLRGRYCDTDRRARSSASRGSLIAVASRRRRSSRRLWGRDRGGRFRTHGRNSHATVRGTRWVVSDSCRGTLTRVTSGAVVVRDKVSRKRVVLEAGQSYLARPRR